MRTVLALAVALGISAGSVAADLASLSSTDAANGLRQALKEGASAAVALLGKENGFFGNPRVRIPLPKSIQQVEGVLRFMGRQDEADHLVLAMNRAAEAAVPEARSLILDAIGRMSVQDAKRILTGGETAATEYFRRETHARLSTRFLPIVKDVTDRSGLAQQYNALAGQGAQFGLVGENEATVEQYVTGKALDGLYLTIAEQEKKFRRNPLEAGSEIVRKVFGVLQ